MKAFIIHGAFGHPGENWFPWLKERLESLGWEVFVPKFPTPEGQTLENWMNVFDEYLKLVDEDTVFIGHSLGVPFILHVLERLEKPVRACYLVSGSARELGNPKFDEINKSFLGPFDWDKIKSNCKRFVVFHSDNDPYVPLDIAKDLAKKLGTELKIIHGAGHFNEKAGYLEFPQLLGEILSLSCYYCNLNDLELLLETKHWKVFLARDQSYLGRALVVLKRHAKALSDLTEDEWLDFGELVKKLEFAAREAFGARMFNWTCLMNNAYKSKYPNPHVHWHFRPRYDVSVTIKGFAFTDPDFGSHYDRARKTEIPQEVRGEILQMYLAALKKLS